MGKIKTIDLPIDYKSLCVESAARGERSDCAVKAVSVVCSVPYAEARDRLAVFGRKDRCGTMRFATERAVLSFGYSIRKWSIWDIENMIRSYPSPHNTLKGITSHHLRRFPESWGAMKDKSFLFFVRGHVFAVKGGEVKDWAANKALRVTEIWEVSKRA